MPSAGCGPRTSVDAGLEGARGPPPRPSPYTRQNSLPSTSQSQPPTSNRRTWDHLRPTKTPAPDNRRISDPSPSSSTFAHPLPIKPPLSVPAKPVLGKLPPPSPNYVPRQKPPPIQPVRKAAMVDGYSQTEEVISVDRSTQFPRPDTMSRGEQADLIAATNVLRGTKFTVMAGTFNVPDLQLVATYLRVNGGQLKVVSEENGPDPRTDYVLVPTVAQTNPDRAAAVIELLAQENSKWQSFRTVTYQWIMEGVGNGCLQRESSDDPDRDRIEAILDELVAVEQLHLSTQDELLDDEAERRLLVCQSMMVRLFRVMLPNTPMWRAMGAGIAPDVRVMTNEELVQSVELASHWKDPAATTCTVPAREEWHDNALDIFLGQESEASLDTDTNAGDDGVAASSSLHQATSRMQIDGDEDEFGAVLPFETPTPSHHLQLNGQGSAQKPIVIDDSDDE